MRIVFFGSSKFGVPCLEKLLDSRHDVCCVVTQPDKKQGRGLRVAGTAVKDLAMQVGLRVFQPVSINDEASVRLLQGLSADVFVIVAYGQRFSQRVLDIPRLLPLNVHASRLPLYRGAAPINWAIMNNDRQTGNTIMKVVSRMDAGPIIAQSLLDILPDDTAITLQERLAQDAPGLLMDALSRIEEGAVSYRPQDESLVSLAPKLDNAVSCIDWHQPAERIHNLVRGCLGWGSAYTRYNGQILKIFRTRLGPDCLYGKAAVPAEVVAVLPDALVVQAGQGQVYIEKLQLEAKRRLDAAVFCQGVRMAPGQRLG